MKQDYEFIKEILTLMENTDSPVIQSETLLEKLNFAENISEREKRDKVFIHLQILADSQCIKKSGTVIKNTIKPIEMISSTRSRLDIGFKIASGYPTPNEDYFRLTKEGYDLLASLENNKIMSKIKEVGGKIAIDVLVQAGSKLGETLIANIPNIYNPS